VLMVYYDQIASPSQFGFTATTAIVAAAIVGGMGNLAGSFVGALLLSFIGPVLQKLVRLSPDKASLWQLVIYGGLLVLVMRLRPGGLIPEGVGVRRRNEPTVLDDVRASDGPLAASVGVGAENAPTDDEPVLIAKGLGKRFGGIHAVDEFDLELRPGRITALVGPNGAGKTTVFNLLTKFLEPTAGRIVYKDRDITRNRPADIARLGMVRSFQISAVFPHLTVRENVRIALQRPIGTSFHFWKSERSLDRLNERADSLVAAVGLAEFTHIPAVELPYGRKRALEIATTLALDPEMLLLDEPMAGLGNEDIARISALIKEVAANRTVLMVEHNLSVVANLSDTITVLTRGRILAEGDYAAVSKNPEVVEAYMGTGHA
jgi:branched-chain amino acid transport system ATP-binding protein